jgi:hypothetical protein
VEIDQPLGLGSAQAIASVRQDRRPQTAARSDQPGREARIPSARSSIMQVDFRKTRPDPVGDDIVSENPPIRCVLEPTTCPSASAPRRQRRRRSRTRDGSLGMPFSQRAERPGTQAENPNEAATAWAASAERPCAKDEPPEARGTRSRGRKVTRSGPRVARPPPPRWASPRPLVIGGKMFDATFFARWTKRKMRRKIVCGSH